MAQPAINYLAVLVSAVIGMVIGALWYSPLLFGKLWMKLSGMTEKQLNEAKKKGMGKMYFVAFIGVLLMSYVLAHFVDYTDSRTFVQGMQTGFWLWLGFIIPILIGSVLWENKSFKFYLLNIIHYLVVLFVMGGILAVWG